MLQLSKIEKRFGDFCVRADFYVQNGETLVIMGPSGSGKTTIINIILGLLSADSGEVLVDGRNISALPPWKRNMSVVFQDLALFPHLDAGQNIEYGLKVRKIAKKERERRVDEMLSLLRLSALKKRNVETLSGGEKQRVAIGRALVVEPAALLLDEPFSGLDEELRLSLSEEFLAIRKKTPAPWLWVTHNNEEARRLGGRILHLELER